MPEEPQTFAIKSSVEWGRKQSLRVINHTASNSRRPWMSGSAVRRSTTDKFLPPKTPTSQTSSHHYVSSRSSQFSNQNQKSNQKFEDREPEIRRSVQEGTKRSWEPGKRVENRGLHLNPLRRVERAHRPVREGPYLPTKSSLKIYIPPCFDKK